MDSLLDPAGNACVVARIQALRPDARRAWGKMDVVAMLVHCQRALQTAVGELTLKRSLVGRLLGGWARRTYIEGDRPFGRNGPTDPALRVAPADAVDFERQRDALVQLVRRFAEPGAISGEPHTFFGPLTTQHWDRLMVKHLDHHLRQFGA